MSDFLSRLTSIRLYCDYLQRHYEKVNSVLKELFRRYSKASELGIPDYQASCRLLADEDIRQAITDMVSYHDISKLTAEEFIPYCRNFYPISNEDKELNSSDYISAWEHHKRLNPHHWEHRAQPLYVVATVPVVEWMDVFHQCCDWVAMSLASGKTYKNCSDWYIENKPIIQLSPAAISETEEIYSILVDVRLDEDQRSEPADEDN